MTLEIVGNTINGKISGVTLAFVFLTKLSGLFEIVSLLGIMVLL